MAAYHGKSGLVYISTSGSGNAASVSKLTDWSVDMATDTVEVTSFGDANKTYVQGLPNLTGSISGLWDSAVDTLFTAQASSDGCKMYIYPSSDAISKYLYGPAWLSVSISGSATDAVKLSGSFSANGSWGVKL